MLQHPLTRAESSVAKCTLGHAQHAVLEIGDHALNSIRRSSRLCVMSVSRITQNGKPVSC